LGGVIFGIVGGFLLRQSEILHLHGFKWYKHSIFFT
jgi:hypothetical protein